MTVKAVSVFMDVEDPVNPAADDAALEFARLFTNLGVRGSFCLTGEKCRTLLARGRTDVLDAFRPHALGLHTDTHSFHPTTMELLADVDWEEGCELAFAAESRGVEAFVAAFGRRPTFWGGGGNTWSPEISEALKRLDIPAYVYALTEFPKQAVHRFNGVFAMPQSLAIGEQAWQNAGLAATRMFWARDQIVAVPQPWVGLFVGHPTRHRHPDFWDVPYFAGRTPPEPEYTDLLPDDVYWRGIENLATFLAWIQERVEIVGVDDVLRRKWTFRAPDDVERAYFEAKSAENLRAAAGWPPHKPGLSAERIVAKTLALADTAEIGELR